MNSKGQRLRQSPVIRQFHYERPLQDGNDAERGLDAITVIGITGLL